MGGRARRRTLLSALAALVLATVGACAEAPRPAPSAPLPNAPAPAKRRDYPRPEVRAVSPDGERVLAQLLRPGVVGWVVFEPSGDDLYTYYALLSDRRRGAERIDERSCRAHAEWFHLVTRGLAPPVTIDPAACAAPERNAVTVAAGRPEPPDWLVLEEHTELTVPGWYPLMRHYGFGTELWVWYLVPLKDGEKPEAGSHFPAGFKGERLYSGTEMPILLPR